MTHSLLLSRQKTGLVVIDMQEKFRPAISGFDPAAHNALKLILAFQLFRMPVLVTEQYPQGLGKTIDPIARQFKPFEPVEKIEFSCTQNEAFWRTLCALKLETLALCGVETHVCISQTALGLLQKGMRVQVVVDAVASRHSLDHDIALRKMERAGATLTTTETALFELCGKAGSGAFKQIQRMVKAKFTGWKSAAGQPTAPGEPTSAAVPAAPSVPSLRDGPTGDWGAAKPLKRAGDDETVLLDAAAGGADAPNGDQDAARRITCALEEGEARPDAIPAGIRPDVETKVFRMAPKDDGEPPVV